LNRIYSLDQDQSSLLFSKKKSNYRHFAYAYKDLDEDEWEAMQAKYNNFEKEVDREVIENELTFVASFALFDSLNKDVESCIKKLKDAKIDVRMISGDHMLTAKAVAVQAGIVTAEEVADDKSGVCLTGDQLMNILGDYPDSQIINGKEEWFYSEDKK
jgi:P-type Ca2+ transporter type 2C